MVELARQRMASTADRRIAALIRDADRQVNDKHVEPPWQREGLKAPEKQRNKGRLRLSDGACIGRWPEYRDHVWSGDLVHCRIDDGHAFRPLDILDEHGKERLAIEAERKLTSTNVIDARTDRFILRAVSAFIRPDNGPEFVVRAGRQWGAAVGAKTACIAPGSPRKNGYCESVDARFRNELLNGETFSSLREARIPTEEWRRPCNTKRPNTALGYRPQRRKASFQWAGRQPCKNNRTGPVRRGCSARHL
ncbi:integrase, catalytic region [Rhodovulum sulfidophilum]|uniref:Integrase, catalytic region n=1 Tax=Rhodovulum sulfidophilum TaxID=35806 RepID=A0A0D6B6X7_RHOSU|nr:integrase, catalytic region [Rhodovulum sulfidophilum]